MYLLKTFSSTLNSQPKSYSGVESTTQLTQILDIHILRLLVKIPKKFLFYKAFGAYFTFKSSHQ